MPRKPFQPGQPKPPNSGRRKGTPNKWNKVKLEALADLIDPDRLLREIAKLAYLDPTSIYDDRGRVLPITDWPPEVRGAVGSLEVVRGNVDEADGKFDEVLRVKLWDKPKALDMLMRHLAMYKDKLDVNVTGAEQLVARLQAGRERVARERRRSA